MQNCVAGAAKSRILMTQEPYYYAALAPNCYFPVQICINFKKKKTVNMGFNFTSFKQTECYFCFALGEEPEPQNLQSRIFFYPNQSFKMMQRIRLPLET
jgi:hypothetical protein